MLKEKYMTPEIEIIEFYNEDVITTSTESSSELQTPPLR